MARFAKDCLEKMEYLSQALVPDLGPDTSDLRLRVGIHSGKLSILQYAQCATYSVMLTLHTFLVLLS